MIPIPSIPPAFTAADINGDQAINGADVAELFAQWGPCAMVTLEPCSADVTGDKLVDGADLSQVLALFGKTWARHDSGSGTWYMPAEGSRWRWEDSPWPWENMRRLAIVDEHGFTIEAVDQVWGGVGAIALGLLLFSRRRG